MKVKVLACASPGSSAIPTDLEGVDYVEDLCRKPGDLTAMIGGADRVVMLVHPHELALADVQQSVRDADIDPLGVQFISAESVAGDAQRARTIVAGSAARAAASSDSRPEHSRATFGGQRSRREVLKLPKPYYEAVPLIHADSCAAADGCRACVGECPETAYRWAAGKIQFDRDACVTCGRCITACPTGAIESPAVSDRALVAQIESLVTATLPHAISVAFVCRQRGLSVSAPGWAEIEVPCSGMVPATWPIAALLMGVAGAAVVPCSSAGCDLGNDDKVAHTVALAASLLEAAGVDPSLVGSSPGSAASELGQREMQDPFGTHGPTEVVMALQAISNTDHPIAVSGSMAFRGVVDIDLDACTLCLTCAETCPSGALSHASSEGRVAVSFDAALCTGCIQCVPACPEVERGAISVERRIDAALLAAGRQTIAEAATVQCEYCGRPIASSAMLGRISELLGDEHDAAMSYLARRCMECRGAS